VIDIKNRLVLLLTFLLLMSLLSCSSKSHKDIIENFVKELNTQDDIYASWLQAAPEFAYELFDNDFVNVVATLYYIMETNQNVSGYIIIDSSDKIIEFSLGEPRYDTYQNSNKVNRSGDKIALQMNK